MSEPEPAKKKKPVSYGPGKLSRSNRWFYRCLGKAVQYGRRQQNVTPEQLATATGFKLATIQCVESGVVGLGVFELEEIAKALQTDLPTLQRWAAIYYLFKRPEDPGSDQLRLPRLYLSPIKPE